VPIAPAPQADTAPRPRRLLADDDAGTRDDDREERFSRRRGLSRRARRALFPSREDGAAEPGPERPSRFAGREAWDAEPADAPAKPDIDAAEPDAGEAEPARIARDPLRRPAATGGAPRQRARAEPPPRSAEPPDPPQPAPGHADATPDDELPAPSLFAARDRPSAPVDHTPDVVVEEGPVVAPGTVAGRALTVVVAIMTFLSVLILGGALLVNRAAEAWSAGVLDEITVAVMPLDGGATERRLTEVADILGATAGIGDVRIGTAEEAEALLEPWLGTGVDLSLLPVPRIVTARVAGDVDREALRQAVAAVEGASLDDHTGWSERLSGMASAASGGAVAALALVLVATALSIVFATRSAIATNAATVEVLHALGAEDGFIVRAFRRRFLAIGITGALAGFGAGVVLFGALDLWTAFSPAATSPQARALFGAPSIGLAGYLLVAAVAAAVAALVAVTATVAVRHNLSRIAR
jgi:cell division transport system permease protein